MSCEQSISRLLLVVLLRVLDDVTESSESDCRRFAIATDLMVDCDEVDPGEALLH